MGGRFQDGDQALEAAVYASAEDVDDDGLVLETKTSIIDRLVLETKTSVISPPRISLSLQTWRWRGVEWGGGRGWEGVRIKEE